MIGGLLPAPGLDSVLGINRRNLEFVHPHNPRDLFPLVDDKARAKDILDAAGVPVPRTLRLLHGPFELGRLQATLGGLDEFVVKPCRGRAGGGILVLTGRQGEGWRDAAGRQVALEDLIHHLGDIFFGVHSFGGQDTALIEERLVTHPVLQPLAPGGLPDLRVLVFLGRPVLAMLRLPTAASGGRANLHQGAVGVGVDLDSGETVRAWFEGRPVDRHPDTGAPLRGLRVPEWGALQEVAVRAAKAFPLGYLGVDACLDARRGPVILELNARPGLEIQNVTGQGLRPLLAAARERLS